MSGWALAGLLGAAFVVGAVVALVGVGLAILGQGFREMQERDGL